MNQDKVSRLSDVEKDEKVKPAYKPGYSERWENVRPTKTIVFWGGLAVIILTIVVGFNWAGWVTGGTAQKMTTDAVTQRLSLICIGQFNQDPQKDHKLTELQDLRSYQRRDYVAEQGWATMPGEAESDGNVADECAKQLVRNSQ
jgi:hypothetical protein